MMSLRRPSAATVREFLAAQAKERGQGKSSRPSENQVILLRDKMGQMPRHSQIAEGFAQRLGRGAIDLLGREVGLQRARELPRVELLPEAPGALRPPPRAPRHAPLADDP